MKSKVLALLFALVLSLSGCLGFLGDDPEADLDEGDDGLDPDAGDGSGDGSDEGEEPSGNQTTYQPPTAALSANLTQGVANLSVAFEVSGTVDEDRDLSWSLDLGDGASESGDELPASIEHVFTAAGNYSVVLEVTDGEETATAMVNITVLEPAMDPVLLTGSAMVIDPIAISGECFFETLRDLLGLPAEDIFGGTHSIASSYWGWSYAFDVEGMIANFWSAGFDFLGSGSSGNVPENAAVAYVCIDDPTVFDVDYTMTLTPA